MQEFIGEDDGTAAPRLSETMPGPAELVRLWRQLVRSLTTLAGLGLAHGDLSAYNLLVHRGRLIMIDLPQVVDVIGHPRGAEFLDRDAANVARWFTARGLTADLLDAAPPAHRATGADPVNGPPQVQASHPHPGAGGRGSGEPGRPGGGAGRAGPVPGQWAEVPAPEDLGYYLLREARLV